MKQPGKIVVYTTKEGLKQKGIAYDRDQVKSFTDFRKIFIELVNDDMSPQLDEKNKKICALKNIDLIEIIGFTD